MAFELAEHLEDGLLFILLDSHAIVRHLCYYLVIVIFIHIYTHFAFARELYCILQENVKYYSVTQTLDQLIALKGLVHVHLQIQLFLLGLVLH